MTRAQLRIVPVAAGAQRVDLVESIRRAEPGAEPRLYAAFGPRVQHLAGRYGRFGRVAAELRSEVMLRVLTTIRSGRVSAGELLAGFVLKTARDVIREFARQLNRRAGPVQAQVSSVDADARAVGALREAIQGFGDTDCAFLRMHYYEDLPHREIARRLGVGVERVRRIESRTLAEFHAAYGGR